MKKIKIYLNYPYDKSGKKLIVLPVVQCLYDYFSKQNNFEVVETIDDIDIFFFFAGGALREFNRYHKFLIKNLEKFGQYIPKFLAKKYMLPNITAEQILKEAKRKNKSMKVIHRLDDRYFYLCKAYGNEKTIINVNKYADATVYQSKYCQTLYEGILPETIFGKLQKLNCTQRYFIYNGTDTNIFSPNGDKVSLKGNINICHIAATGMPRKGLSMVLAIAEILKNNKNIHFYLIGNQNNDPLSGHFINSLENVTHLPFIDDRYEMAKYMRSMDLLLFPSIDDCSPNTVIEAMASGLPVLADASGGVPELIHKDDGLKGGLFIDKENPIFNLKIILENHASFKKNALEIVNKYHTLEIMCNNYKNLIYKLLDMDK